eukprot:540068-Pelagomonas_calceolata.AAC.1
MWGGRWKANVEGVQTAALTHRYDVKIYATGCEQARTARYRVGEKGKESCVLAIACRGMKLSCVGHEGRASALGAKGVMHSLFTSYL